MVSRNDERSRYEGRLDGALVTVIDFVRDENVLEVTHTGTRIRFRGRGFAGAGHPAGPRGHARSGLAGEAAVPVHRRPT